MDALSPDLLILPGNVQAVSTVGTRSTYTILKELSQNGVPMYATALYEPYMDAIVISMDEALSDNVPAEINVPAWFPGKAGNYQLPERISGKNDGMVGEV